MRRFVFIAVIVSLISACAPGITSTAGEFSSNPFVLGEDDIVVEAGKTYYLTSFDEEALELFDVQLERGGSTNLGRYYTDLPSYDSKISGVSEVWLKLQSARGLREITNSRGTGSAVFIGVKDSVEFNLTLTVPENTEPGSYLGQVTVSTDKANMTFNVPFTVKPAS